MEIMRNSCTEIRMLCRYTELLALGFRYSQTEYHIGLTSRAQALPWILPVQHL